VASVAKQATLAAILADLEKKFAVKHEKHMERFDYINTLLVPNMAWKTTHRFKELEGADKQFLNPMLKGRNLDTAEQTIQFRLDRSGAELSSEAKLSLKSDESDKRYHLNRPFLLYMKKRDAKQPFFVMWIDNAELLQK
jgi:hypothetical protein